MLPNFRIRLLTVVVAAATFLALPSCAGSGDPAKKEAPKEAPKDAAKDAAKPAEKLEAGAKPEAAKPEAAKPVAKPEAAKPADATKPAPAPAKKQTMDEAITELMAKPEQPDESITVQHVLIGYKGAPRLNVQRSKDEAKALAEKLWAEAIGGADFKTLMKQSDDTGGGEYPMTKAGRMQMVAAFGDVGFRLKVGEIGVAPQDAKKSPYGWHIIKRVK